MPNQIGSSDLYLTDVSPQDKPWDKHRANAETVQQLYRDSEYCRYADRIEECSRLLGFAFEAQDSGQLKLRLKEARFCRVRFCPVCQWRRILMWRARFFQAVPKIMKDYPTAKWAFLTLTVRNCELSQLRMQLKEMNKAWDRLTKRKQFPAIGFIRSTEVTKSEDGTAHPHFHCLLMVPASYFSTGYIKQSEWTELWKQVMRLDYTPIVDVRAVRPRKKPFEGTDSSDLVLDDSGVARAILETMKYGVKESDLMSDAHWLQELTRQLHKTRAISVGGVLKNYINEEEPEDLIQEEGEESTAEDDVSIWFGWREMVKRFAKVEP